MNTTTASSSKQRRSTKQLKAGQHPAEEAVTRELRMSCHLWQLLGNLVVVRYCQVQEEMEVHNGKK